MARCGSGGQEVDDIEDLLNNGDAVRSPPKRHILPKKIAPRSKGEQKEHAARSNNSSSNIPGVQSIYVKTWGCSHNNSDGEYMAGQLAAYGYSMTDDAMNADLWLLNSCTVKGPSEDSFRNAIASGQQLNKHLVIAGCVPQGHRDDSALRPISAVGVQQIDRVVEVVEETLKGHTVRLFGTKKNEDGQKSGGASLDLPKIRKNPLIEILAVNTGCLNQCTYCKTKHARGELGSYPPEQLVARAKQAFEEGVREIWLTSEDLGAYGHDIGVRIPELLWQLVDVIPEGAMMRLGMTNPPYILEHMEEIAKVLDHPRVYSFLHVPVQAGSDAVLEAMKREYTRADFEHVVDFLKEKVPRVTIATDLICGFPTETEEDFKQSIELVEKYKFPSLFINQFYPRPGTPAARMKRIPTQDVKNRSRAVSKVFQSYRTYDHQVGERQWVLVTEIAHDKEHLVAHNKSYDQVLLEDVDGLMGKYVEVDITSAGKHYLMATLVPGSLENAVRLPQPLAKGTVSGAPDGPPPLALHHSPSSSSWSSRWSHCYIPSVILVLFLAIIIRCAQLVQLPER